jgi:hypothetical protein
MMGSFDAAKFKVGDNRLGTISQIKLKVFFPFQRQFSIKSDTIRRRKTKTKQKQKHKQKQKQLPRPKKQV